MLPRPRRQVGLVRLAIDVRRVRGVSDHHRLPAVDVYEHALMADRVTGRRDNSDARGDLGVTVEQLESRTREIEPFRSRSFLAPRPLELRTLNVKGRLLEHGVLP